MFENFIITVSSKKKLEVNASWHLLNQDIQGAALLALIRGAASDWLLRLLSGTTVNTCTLYFKVLLIAFRSRHGIGKTSGKVGFTTNSIEVLVI